MKKVLLVFDGQHFSKGAFDFACYLNRTHPVLVTGIFMPSIDYTDMMVYYMGIEGPLYLPYLDFEEETIESNIEQFKNLCAQNNIAYKVHEHPIGSIVSDIKRETRYSDLLILSSELFYSNLGIHSQHGYLRDTAHNAECPVLLLPEKYELPKSIVLAFDGSRSSVYAIRQFAYLFPELTALNTVLVYSSKDGGDLPGSDFISEFTALHFPNTTVMKLDTDPHLNFDSWITQYGPAIVVAGAHGRSMVSEMFHESFINRIIKEHNVPVFITHH